MADNAGSGARQVARWCGAFVRVALIGTLMLGLTSLAGATGLGGSGSLVLDGVDDYATAPDGAYADVGTGDTSDFTLEAMFKVSDTAGTQTANLFYKGSSYIAYILLNVGGTSADRVIFRLYTGGTNYVYPIFPDVDLSTGWHHIAFTFDNEYAPSGDRYAVYLDGTLLGGDSAVDWSPGLPNSAGALYVGGYAGINSLPGELDEVRISDTVRYTGSYSVPSAPFVADGNTLALWHFDEAAGTTTFADSSGGGHTLTGANGAAASGGNDLVGPTMLSLASSTHPSEATWYQSASPSFSWSASDPESGVSGYSYALDHAASTTPDTVSEGADAAVSFTGLADGEWYLHVRAVDGSGNWGDPLHRRVRVDTTDPQVLSTSSSTHPDPDTWYSNSSPAITWTASDDGSGVSGYSFAIDHTVGTTPDTVSEGAAAAATFNSLADGEWYFHVRAVDAAGRWGTTLHRRVLISTGAPGMTSLSSSTHSDPNTWYSNNAPTFTWSAVAGGAAITGYSYVLDHNASTLPDTVSEGPDTSHSYGPQSDGDWYMHVRAVDAVNQWSGAIHLRVRIDATPASMVSVSSSTHPDPNVAYVNASPSFGWSAGDAGSGVAGYSYLLDQSPATMPDTQSEGVSTTHAYGAQTAGDWYFHVRAVDAVGGWGSPMHLRVRIASQGSSDTAPPTVLTIGSPTHPDPNQWYAADDATFVWTADDDMSGVAGFSFMADQLPWTVPDASVDGTSPWAAVNDLPLGENYFHVRAVDGAGNWGAATHMKVRVLTPTTLSLQAPLVSVYGSAALSGRLVDGRAVGLSGQPIEIWFYSAGWKQGPTVYTGPGGLYSITATPTVRMTYKAVFDGSPGYGAQTSRQAAVLPRVRLTRSTSWVTLYRYKTYAALGYVEPRHFSSSGKIVIRAYKRRSDGSYPSLSSPTKTFSYGSSYVYLSTTKTRYRVPVTFTSRGVWKLVAYHAADSQNAATYGSADFVVVR